MFQVDGAACANVHPLYVLAKASSSYVDTGHHWNTWILNINSKPDPVDDGQPVHVNDAVGMVWNVMVEHFGDDYDAAVSARTRRLSSLQLQQQHH